MPDIAVLAYACSSAMPIAPDPTCTPSAGPNLAMYGLAPEGSISPTQPPNAPAASEVVPCKTASE